MSYTTVVVGTDGSTSSLVAVDRAVAQLADTAEAQLIVVCAYCPAGSEYDGTLTPRAAQEAVRAAVARVVAAGAPEPQTELVEGSAHQALLSVAEAQSADLIVLAKRGLGPATGPGLGSVPSVVIHRAGCDVLVVAD
ncbi:universal stress protein [Dactylosporangium sp. AC04546]|uniref:universal stress protein n=1 Tax=Dactylosporangium sp. AC04546 TaxID=2862460 RepID=UPI001EDFD566|nr:universal stress protein [Dactylosporangium sp. AC04546]WVK80355.1 universal stress protein [Dactylosporangium sp. AC04546]